MHYQEHLVQRGPYQLYAREYPGEGRGPVPEAVPNGGADGLVVIGDFGTEVAEEAPPRVPVLDDLVAEELEVGADPLQRLDRTVGELVDLPPLPVPLERHDRQRLLAVEVVVERPLRHAGRVGDVLDAGAVVAADVELLQRGRDDLVPHALSSHGHHSRDEYDRSSCPMSSPGDV